MLTRFRNMDRDGEELAHVADVRVDQPLLFLGGDRDSAVHAHGLEAMKASVPICGGSCSFLAVGTGRSRSAPTTSMPG
jgi:hypothetical protein